ncbi:hypothetical protein Tco_0814732 [Tanacetum coccineum]
MTPYTGYPDVQGIIYQDELSRNRLMRTDELHKFSDGTLNHVGTTLNDIATEIQMDYLPKRTMSPQDKRSSLREDKCNYRKLSRSKIVCVQLGEVCRRKTVRGRPSAARKDHMIYHMLSSSLLVHSTLSSDTTISADAHVKGELLRDIEKTLKIPAMFLNFMGYKVVRHRYSNPMIQPEPEGSTQGYPLVSVEVLRFYTSAGNPVKEILLKLNLPDHRILKDGGEVKEFQRSFRHSDTERLSRSDEVLKLKNFKKDATLKLSKSTNQEWYEHVGPEVTRSQDDKVTRWRNEIMLG